MAADPNNPETLTVVANEFEALSLVQELAARGISGYIVGDHTAGFRADSPGRVCVLVRQADLAKAEQAMVDIQQHLGQVDWSNIDVGLLEGS